MRNKKCPICNSPMVRNGKTSSGAQRWRCRTCGGSLTHRYDSESKQLEAFVNWLLSKQPQIKMPGQGRTFRRKTSKFWEIWPMPEVVDEVHRVIYVDGIWINREAVVLIACSEEHVLSWYLARSENSNAWRALMSRVAPPELVVTDGGSGFAKAVKAEWPSTRVQRCTFHAFCQVKRYTTSLPKLLAGRELYSIAKELLTVKTPRQAQLWIDKFLNWCDFWNDFLNERSIVDGKKVYTHERLRKARRGLVKLINEGTLFTYLEPELCLEGPLPSTNNRIEGAINSQLRSMLREHRGLSALRRIKAVFWWCYMHVECPKSMSQTLQETPTDEDIELLREVYGINAKEPAKPQKWGTGIVWEEFHLKTRYPDAID